MLAGVLYDVMEREGISGKYGEHLLGLFKAGTIESETIDAQYRQVLSQRLGEAEANETYARIDRAYERVSSGR